MRSLDYDYVRQGDQLAGLSPLRVALVAAIIATQSAEVSESFGAFSSSPLWLLPQVAWCGLFALAGFTLQASRARHDLRAFAWRRVIRFAPAYAFAILMALLALGPLFTSSSVINYFSDGESWAYLLNLVAVPRMFLPGVFEFNVLNGTVNGVVSWAPAVVLLGAAIAGAPYARRWQAWVLPATALAFTSLSLILWAADLIPEDRTSFVRSLFAGAATAPLFAGLLGAIAWQFRKRVPLDRRIGAIAAVLLAIATVAGNPTLDNPLVLLPLAAASAYLMLQAAARRRPGERAAERVSALLYPALCFAFPIQQMVATTSWGSANVAINLATSLPAIVATALMWSFIEARTLRRFVPAPLLRDESAAPLLRRRRQNLVDRLRTAGWFVLVGLIMVAILTALMALTGYALQRPAEGM